MARPPRLNIPGATYHVMARGNRKECIFFDDADRYRFLRILTQVVEEFAVDVLVDCQMSNHFHLIVSTPNGNVSEFMQQLEGQFGQYLNRRHHRVGHVFQGPFKRVMIEHDMHLLIAVNYVLMNPVDAGVVSHPSKWRWCSYSATAGLAPTPSYLSTQWLDVLFPSESPESSRQLFVEFIANPKPVEAYLADEIAFGSHHYKKIIRSYIGERFMETRVPRSYRALGRPSIEALLGDVALPDRALAIQRACVVYGYRQSEVAEAIRLHPASVSRIVCSLRKNRKR